MSISAVSGSGASYGLAEMMQAQRGNQSDSDETVASIAKKDAEDGGGFMASMQGSASSQGEASSARAVSGTGESESSSDEEEYDAYDLNEDGVVTVDELLQAFRQGDASVQALFEGSGGSSALLQRLASQAYEAQNAAV
ncbi:hypothetical protein [Desulfovibrio sp. Fe33]|uniref:hypothetical protein n=1 Tax=Desulfovibrio sp. Fe33 TaxID=3020842 RepID=UPI00234D5478|nr:hypothetical protein [Desulfovibrio sp. Fe33]